MNKKFQRIPKLIWLKQEPDIFNVILDEAIKEYKSNATIWYADHVIIIEESEQ